MVIGRADAFYLHMYIDTTFHETQNINHTIH